MGDRFPLCLGDSSTSINAAIFADYEQNCTKLDRRKQGIPVYNTHSLFLTISVPSYNHKLKTDELWIVKSPILGL
jgi:hypothetical protein